MRFRKLAGLVAGAVAASGMSAVALAAPAQADEGFAVEAECKYQSFTMEYDTAVSIVRSGSTITATLPGTTTLGEAAARLDIQGFGAQLVLNVGGQFVTLKGKTMFTAPLPKGNTDFTAPALTGELKYGVETADADLAAATIESLALDLSLFNQSALAHCSGTGITPSPLSFDTQCRYQSFALPWQGAIDVDIDGTDVSATIPAKASMGSAGARIDMQGFGARLTLDIGGETVVLSGKEMFTAPLPKGNTYFEVPTLEGELTAAPAEEAEIAIHALDLDLSLFDAHAFAGCSTTGTTLTATSAAPHTSKLEAVVAPATAGKVEFYEGATKLGEKAVTASNGKATLDLTGVAGAVEKTYSAKFVPTSGRPVNASQSSNVKVKVVASTTTALTAASPGANAVSLAATVTPAAAGKVEFKLGATKVGEAAVAAGKANLALTGVPAGTHGYTATFVPADATLYATSTSAAATVTVAAPPAPGKSPQCVNAESGVTTATAAVAAAEKKAKAAKAKVTKLNKQVKKAKSAKAKKAAQKKLKAAKKALSKANNGVKTAKAGLTKAQDAVKAAC